MMYLDKPPQLVETRMFSSMPAEFRRPGVSSKWADANRGPIRVDCSIEGPSFDIPSAAFSGIRATASGLS